MRPLEITDLPDENGARRQQLRLTCGAGNARTLTLDLRIPKGASGPLPIILTGDAGSTPIADEVLARGYMPRSRRFWRAAKSSIFWAPRTISAFIFAKADTRSTPTIGAFYSTSPTGNCAGAKRWLISRDGETSQQLSIGERHKINRQN